MSLNDIARNRSAGAPGPVPAAAEHGQAEIILGMPHLGADGLCENWLLRMAGHRHWMAVAAAFGAPTHEIRDAEGDRMFASIVHCAVDGRASLFRENDMVRIEMAEDPAPRNGWRSVTRVVRPCGLGMSVTLQSVFVKRCGQSNARLVRATAPGLDHDAGDLLAARLRARARAALEAARHDESDPLTTTKVVAAVDFNGVGLCYFANFIRFFTLAEAARLPSAALRIGLAARRAHWFGNCDDGETLELRCSCHAPATDDGLGLETFVSVRRASDGVVIGVCETLRLGAPPPEEAL